MHGNFLWRPLLVFVGVGVAGACSLLNPLDGEGLSGGDRADASAPVDRRTPVGDGESGDARSETGTTPPSSSSYRDVVLSDGPLAYYRLGDSSAVAKDEVGGPDGTHQGNPTRADGAIAGDEDGATRFGGGSFIDLGAGFPFAGRAPFTIEAWVKPDGGGGPNDSRCVVAKSPATINDGYALFVNGDEPYFGRYPSNEYTQGSGVVPPGVFSHLVTTYDGTTLALYVNGELSGTETSTHSLGAVDKPQTIGASRGGTTCYFAGVIDEVAIYGSPLSVERIRAHHRAGTGLP